mmetsp:Transcript_104303/g.185429  ORF Transcript_104303/g.185429 Transcript_104303/m.185429 type:complete len:242 (+) Transcript_104303:153-878(+)|eukprot:CAMPEP_0197644326 /NCGR_PEP_ID=MMETSP1338-20131121/17339_1 /TAXON_ID=43686 ORGANISM="Pelagodinium beii, Strain RCC1491" /NCGR_SAMPLE_ID=MMETSP1338 /ASSEMBLY_ACC=CAM_ASM_000754 /LENGTH=241 /DNA_ID=CAMNT_0043217709 /DNA_START=133 /DNA_END=858 /DNA_ORIENTATION=-
MIEAGEVDDINLYTKEYDKFNADEASTTVGTCVQSREPTFLDNELENQRYFDDLREFSTLLNQYLTSAQIAFSMADQELSMSFHVVITWSFELFSQASSIANKIISTAAHEDFGSLPDLIFEGVPDPEAVLSEAESRLSCLRQETREVRSNYIALLDYLGYLSSVAEVSLADFEMKQADAYQASMELGIYRLQVAQDHLEELSIFWLVLHSTELELGHAEEGVQCLALSACPGGLNDCDQS